MYISAQSCTLGTLSEFSSVPILVAVELDPPYLVHHDSKGNTLLHRRNLLSLEQLSYDCDLAIHIATTHNIRTHFLKTDHPGGQPHHTRRLSNRKGISFRNIPYT